VSSLPRGFIVTGTDTNVGKTVVAAGLARAFGASYWKPIQAGLDAPTDSETVARLAGANRVTVIREAYRLATPCSPHEAARLDGVTIEQARLGLPAVEGPLIIEGAGGLMVPVTRDLLMIDLLVGWSLPVVLVARTALGTINHSLLSIKALRDEALDIAGLVFVGEENAASETAIIEHGRVAHLGRLPWLERLEAGSLAAAVKQNLRLDRLR
jgi:dethiobiotin synthetase